MAKPAEAQAWDKMTGESYKAHRAFKAFLNLGVKRGQTQAAWDLKCSVALIKKWSTEWKWYERADAWDTYISSIEQAAKERVAREVAERYARRKIESADANWDKAQEIRAWADDARAQCPMFEREVLDTRTVQVYDPETGKVTAEIIPTVVIQKPLKWTAATILEAYKTVAALQAAAIQEATQGVLEDDGFDPLGKSPEELRAWLAKKGAAKAITG